MEISVTATKLKTVRGSGNIFRDLKRPQADLQQFKALLAAEIVRALDEHGFTVREAESLTRIAAADFSRIRNANLGRFTIDRLMTILNRLGRNMDVTVRVRSRAWAGVVGKLSHGKSPKADEREIACEVKRMRRARP
jgi:predicted XRE-type DNA-binding protein